MSRSSASGISLEPAVIDKGDLQVRQPWCLRMVGLAQLVCLPLLAVVLRGLLSRMLSYTGLAITDSLEICLYIRLAFL